jgi:hypothetical protein
LKKWKQNLGRDATYSNLIKRFEQACYKDYVKIVEDLVMKNVQTDKNTINQTLPTPSKQPLLQSPESPKSPLYKAATEAKLQQEDYNLGT